MVVDFVLEIWRTVLVIVVLTFSALPRCFHEEDKLQYLTLLNYVSENWKQWVWWWFQSLCPRFLFPWQGKALLLDANSLSFFVITVASAYSRPFLCTRMCYLSTSRPGVSWLVPFLPPIAASAPLSLLPLSSSSACITFLSSLMLGLGCHLEREPSNRGQHWRTNTCNL